MRKPIKRPAADFWNGCNVIVTKAPRGFEFTKNETKIFKRLIENKTVLKFANFITMDTRTMAIVYLPNDNLPWWFDVDALVRVK